MFEYILECGDEQLLNTTLSAKAQIYLLLHLVCRVDREILDDIYKLKCQYEDDEKRESLVYNKNYCMAYIRYGMCITSQINTMYPYYMMYNEKYKGKSKVMYVPSINTPYSVASFFVTSAIIGIFMSPRPPLFLGVLVHAKWEYLESHDAAMT